MVLISIISTKQPFYVIVNS